MRRVRDADGAALSQLYRRFVRPCYSLARRICANEKLAEEVVQEVFLALWRDPTRYDPARGGFATWLLTVTHHRAVDAVRKESTIHRGERPQLVLLNLVLDSACELATGLAPAVERADVGRCIAVPG